MKAHARALGLSLWRCHWGEIIGTVLEVEAPGPLLFRVGVALKLLEDNLATVITALEVWLSFHLISPLLGTDPKEIIG